MNVEWLLTDEAVNGLLADGNWKYTDYYELDSGSQYFGCVNLITLSKQITTSETAALIYLFQRIHHGALLKKDDKVLAANELLHWLIGAGYIGSTGGAGNGAAGLSEGVKLLPKTAASKVQEIIQMQLQSKDIRVFKNGQEITPVSLFSAQSVIAVTAFRDTEDDYLYFIETASEWMYFNAGA